MMLIPISDSDQEDLGKPLAISGTLPKTLLTDLGASWGCYAYIRGTVPDALREIADRIDECRERDRVDRLRVEGFTCQEDVLRDEGIESRKKFEQDKRRIINANLAAAAAKGNI